jgi:16S rRNA (cytosine1402-N4)-methyltransferase
MDGPLDMRMDQESFISAYDLVNSLSEKEISYILKNYGQERWHSRIAHFLVVQRNDNPLESTSELRDIVVKAIPSRYRRQKIHPATRTFQAIRIAVNRELEALEIALDKSVEVLRSGGRICVIAFHSLEDKIVKEKFRYYQKAGKLQVLTKKPQRPTVQEIKDNPRARSARLRAAERI